MKRDCDICRGYGKVRLPIYHRAMVFSADVPSDPVESSREYPCPKCADVTHIERVQAAREETMVATYTQEPGFIEHVKGALAHHLADHLLENGYIRFERAPDDEQDMRFAMRATIGVVRPNQLDNLEERLSERQTEVAEALIQEASRQINSWGSHYGRDHIAKSQATGFVREALGAVLKKRSEWKQVAAPRAS